MIEDLRGQDHLVGTGRGDEGGQSGRTPLSGDPIGAHTPSHVPRRPVSIGVHRLPCCRRGGCSGPESPRRRLTHCCCSEVTSRCASASVSAATTFTPTIAYGCASCVRRPELRAIHLQRLHQVVGREVRGERERHPERGSQLGAEEAGAEQPDRHLRVRRRAPRGPPGPAATGREVRLQLLHVVAESSSASDRNRGASARAVVWSVPGARPRPRSMRPGIERFERAELLGDDERRVIRQHDAAGADANRRRAAGDVPDDDRCRRAGDARHVVMLGQPVARVAPAARRVAPDRACCAGPAAADRPRRWGKDRGPKTGCWALPCALPELETHNCTGKPLLRSKNKSWLIGAGSDGRASGRSSLPPLTVVASAFRRKETGIAAPLHGGLGIGDWGLGTGDWELGPGYWLQRISPTRGTRGRQRRTLPRPPSADGCRRSRGSSGPFRYHSTSGAVFSTYSATRA